MQLSSTGPEPTLQVVFAWGAASLHEEVWISLSSTILTCTVLTAQGLTAIL